MRAGYCRFKARRSDSAFPCAVPRAASFLQVPGEGEAAMPAKKKAKEKDADGKSAGAVAEHGGDGAEVAGDRVQVVEYAAAIDVAKGFGMVCTRVPGSRPDRRRQEVWRVEAAYREVIALMDHLRCEGIQRLVLESTPVIRGRQQASATAGDRPALSVSPIRRGRVICRTVCDADSRLWRSSDSHLSSLPILPPRRGRVCHDTTCAMSNFWLLNPG